MYIYNSKYELKIIILRKLGNTFVNCLQPNNINSWSRGALPGNTKRLIRSENDLTLGCEDSGKQI